MRDALPMHALLRRCVRMGLGDALDALAKMQDRELDDPAAALTLQDAIVATMWVDPRVVLHDGPPEEGEVSINDLSDAEVEETIDLALGGVASAATFPGDGDGSGGGDGGEDVGVPAKRRAGSKPGKR